MLKLFDWDWVDNVSVALSHNQQSNNNYIKFWLFLFVLKFYSPFNKEFTSSCSVYYTPLYAGIGGIFVRMSVCLSVIFSVKYVSGTIWHRTLKFGTNIWYDKL